MLYQVSASNVTSPAVCLVLLPSRGVGSTPRMPKPLRVRLSDASARMLITERGGGGLFRTQKEATLLDSYV